MVENGYFRFATGLNRLPNTQRGMFDAGNAEFSRISLNSIHSIAFGCHMLLNRHFGFKLEKKNKKKTAIVILFWDTMINMGPCVIVRADKRL